MGNLLNNIKAHPQVSEGLLHKSGHTVYKAMGSATDS